MIRSNNIDYRMMLRDKNFFIKKESVKGFIEIGILNKSENELIYLHLIG